MIKALGMKPEAFFLRAFLEKENRTDMTNKHARKGMFFRDHHEGVALCSPEAPEWGLGPMVAWCVSSHRAPSAFLLSGMVDVF